MPSYSYIDKAGKTQSVTANDPQSALSSATNIDPTSGVALNTPTYTPNTNVSSLNEQRNIAVESGKDPYAGNLKNISSFLNTPISSNNLKQVSPYNLTPPSVPTAYSPILAGSDVLYNQISEQNKRQLANIDEARSNKTSLQDKIVEAIGGRQKLEEKYKVQEKTNAEAEAEKTLTDLKLNRQQELKALESANMTDAGRAVASRDIINRYSMQEAVAQINYYGASKNLELANASVEKAINFQLEPLKLQYQFAQDNYDEIKGDLTKSEDRLFKLMQEERQQQLDAGKEKEKAIQGIISKSIENGINLPSSFVNQAIRAKDANEVYSLASQLGVNLQKPKSSGSNTLSILDVQRYRDLYPEANVQAGDTESVANAKVAKSNSPEAKTRTLIEAAKSNGNDYETVVREINNDNTIKDKSAAIKIAQSVYGDILPKPDKVGFIDSISSFLFGK